MRKVYLSLFTILISLFSSVVAEAQLTGTKTIPGDYATIAAAVTDLNAQGVGAGGVIFNVAAGYTETIASVISLTATGTVANPIVFQKSGAGANPVITAYVGTNTPATAAHDDMWRLIGSDYVTIDGINLNDPNVSNPASMEGGFVLYKASLSDGAQNNTIKNCVITLNRVNNATGSGPSVEGSRGIEVTNATAAAAVTSLTPTTAAGTNSNNKFYGNTIQNCNYGIVLSGFAASTPFTAGDTGNDIGGSAPATGNTILNYGGGAATNPAAAVRANNQWSANISYNTINNNNGSGVNHATTLRGIYGQAGTSANATINSNTITINSGATTSAATAIENVIGSTAASNTIDINNNIIQNSTYTTATTGTFTGILNGSTASTVNINGNTINNNTVGTSGVASVGIFQGVYSSASATNLNINNNTVTNNAINNQGGTMYCLRASTSIYTVNGNTISNNSIPFSGGSSTSILYGFYDLTSPTSETIQNNQINNLTITGNTTSTSNIIMGVHTNTAAGSKTWNGNVIHTLTFSNSSTGTAVVNGLSSALSTTINFYKNKIYNLSAAGSTSLVSGILLSSTSTSATVTISNNLIGGLHAPSGNNGTTDNIRGINLTATTATTPINVYHNTIYLAATSTGANFSSSGIFHTTSATATTAALDLRNNIIVNTSTANGTGLTIAYRRSSTTLTNYGSNSNYNLFYAGTPSMSNVIFYDGTNADQQLADFQSRVNPSDIQSITENPPFLSTNGANATFLHINPAIATLIESGSVPVAGITDDFDGDTRNVATPDIGADEGNFTLAAGMTYISSTTTQTNTSNVGTNTTNQQVIGVQIVTNGASSPLTVSSFTFNTNGTTSTTNIANARLFYTGTNPVFGTSAQFGADVVAPNGSFVVPGSQQLSEGTNYFWLTYDVLCSATAGNVIDAECNSLTVGTPKIPTVQAPAGSRTIEVGPLSGTYTVGAAGNYPTLTAAVADVNGKGLRGNTILKILNNLTEAGAVTINQWPECGGSNFTLTIKPETATTPTISANAATAVIILNGADRVTIDGSNSGGTDKSLTISNISTTAGSAVIWVKSLGAGVGAIDNTIKNCNILAGITQNTSNNSTYGIVMAGSTLSATHGSITAGDDNDNNIIQGNSFSRVRYGVYSRGGSSGNPNNGTMIKNNIIGPSSFGADEIGKAGIVVREEDGVQITGNTIRFVGGDFANTVATGTDRVAITLGTDATWTPTSAYIKNAIITNNIISDIVEERTFSAVGIAVGAADATNSTNNLIANNVITNIKANGTSSDQAIGIGLSASNTDIVVFNSIYMTGDTDPNASASTPTVSNFGISISSVSAVVSPQILNNVIYMDLSSSTAPTLKNACINVPATYVWGGGISNYNDLYYNPANTQSNTGCVGGSGGTFHLTLTAWQGAVSQDGNSLQADPLFNSPSNLRPLPGSLLIGAGISAAGVTTDILGTIRSGTPTIGAYELAGDFTGPTISYTALTGTACPTDRALTPVTITDISGVNVTPGTKPRLYFKKSTNANTYNDNTNGTDGWKYVESVSAGSPFSFTTNYSLINGGVAGGDIIQYFVVAQDLFTTANVSINSGTFASAPATVALSSAAFPIGGAINSYTISATVPSVITIGAAGTYTSLTKAGGLFADINAKGLGANTVVTILDATVDEDGANALNQITYGCAGPYTLTIKPAPGVSTVLSGSNANALIDLNGADNVIFDGSNSGTSTKDMIIRNSNTSGATIRFINDAVTNTVKNCVLEAATTSTTTGVIAFSTSVGTLGNSNNIVMNNSIRDRSDATAAFAIGIYSSGTASALNASNTISGNNIFNFTANGINLTSTGIGSSWQITGNSFFNNLAIAPSTAQTSILVSGGSSHAIIGNYIGGQSPNAGGSAWTNTGNATFNGINLAAVGGSGAVSVQNNTVQNFVSTATGAAAFNGILVSGASTVNVGTVTGNLIGHPTTANSIQSSGLSTVIGISSTSTGAMVISNNTVANITSTGATTAVGVRGISHTGSGTLVINNNAIKNISSATATTSLTTSALLGIYTASSSTGQMITNNTISGLVLSHPTAVNYVQAINLNSANTATGTVSGNRISNIQNTSVVAATVGANIIGIDLYTGSWNVFNNFISIDNAANTNHIRIIGIWDWPGGTYTGNIYHNTVFVSGTGSGSDSTYAYERQDGGTSVVKNNIFYNNRTGGTGNHYAISDRNTAPGTLFTSDYNDLFAGNASSVGEWGIGTSLTFAQWQASSSGDVNSVSVLPVFTSSTDLHLVPASNISLSNLGTPIVSVTTDIDGDLRDVATPDMGADEFITPCTGAVGGTAVASPTGPFCGSGSTTVSSTGYSLGFGSTYLWQSSVDAAFTTPVDIGTATSGYSNLSTGTISTTTYYRLKVTCPSGTATAYSNVVTVTITPTPSATISYTATPYCSNAGTVTVTQTGTTGGTYSSTAGLSINASTGAITLGTSIAGTYTVTYTIAAAGGCTQYQTTTTVAVEAAPSASISYVGTPFCSSPGTATVTQTGTAGGTYSSTAGLVINSSTGAVDLGASIVGTYTVTYTVAAAGACPIYQTTAIIDITTSPSAVISYSGSPYCSNGGTANVTRTGSAGGTYTSTAGLSINASTGAVTLGTSTPGTYTVTYSIVAAGGCSAFQTTTSITITAAPAATISYAGSPYCTNGGTATVTQTGSAGGTYTSTAGLSINASTGAVTLGTSTAGTYIVTYTVAAANGCAQFQTTGSITITAAPAATISYAGSPYCSNGGTANVTRIGTAGGTYTSTAGLSINASTGAVTLGTSTAGTYTVTYTVAAASGCAQFQTTAIVTITAAPTATISYAGSPYCSNGTTATVTQTGTAGGTYTSTAGLSINASTGAVTLGTSTPGTYTVTYTVAAANGCAQFQTTGSITITAAPTATIAYAGSPFCIGGTVSVTQTGTVGGTYTSTAGLSINAVTGQINLATSTAGAYTITYTVAAANGCAQLQATTNIVISANGSWIGVVSNNWNTAGNWCGGVPTSTTDVIIPSTAPNMPNLSAANGTARNISIANGATLTIGAGGILDLYGNITGAGVFNATAGSIAFRSATAQTVPGFTATNVTMNGAGGVTPGGNTTVTGALTLTNGNITLGNNNITLNSSSTGSAASHIISNGTGNVVVANLAASQTRTIPVGTDATSYNPATLAANAGHTTDNFTVRVQQGVFVNGVSGTTYTTHVADRMWIINEGTGGGSNVNVTLQWTGAQELTNFTRTKCYVMQHNGTAWSQGTPTAATGTDPYTQTKQNVTTFSPFAVETERIPRPVTGIYPNPTSDVLNVVTDLLQGGPVVFSVYDMKGRLVYRRQATLTAGLSQTTLSLVGLSAGTYVLKASTALNREFLSQKFIKVN